MMTHAHGGVLVILVAFFLGVAAGNLALASLHRLGRRQKDLAPREAVRLAGALLALPAFFGATFVMVTLLVPAASLFFPELDHCGAVLDAPHVCFVHGTWTFDSGWEALFVTALLACAALALGGEVIRLWQAHRVARMLLDGERPAEPVSHTEDEEPFAFTVGVLRPHVIVSEGLLRALTGEQMAAALAHELAHAQRRHTLARVLLRVVGAFVLPRWRRDLLGLVTLGQEEEADDDAAVAVGSRELVAETLLACVRSRSSARRHALAPGLWGPALEERVEALCQPARRGRVTRMLVTSLAVVFLAVFAAQGPLHRASEEAASFLFSSPVHSHGSGPSSDGTE